jgi:hypothetical protein
MFLRVLKPHQLESLSNKAEGTSFVKERDVFLKGFIGTNRTGKSVTMKMLADEWVNSKPDHYKVAAYDPQHRFEDITDFRLYTYEMDNAIDTILSLRNALLIIDDIREFHPKKIAQDWMLHLLSARSQWNIDIMYAVHNPSLLLNTVSNYTTHYYIFYTETLNGGWDKKVSNYKFCRAASTEVNKYISTKGRGTYPKFPHILVDNEANDENKLIAINMKY